MNDIVPFNSLSVGDYFFFTDDHQIRKKVSIKKYIWICDGNTMYCENIHDEESAPKWRTTRRHIPKCTKVNFRYSENEK